MSTINVTNLSGRGGATPNLPDGANITGVATATSFDGNLKSTGTPTLGLGVTINASGVAISGVCTAGIVSATTFYGSGSNLTGVGESIAPWYYNPDAGDTQVRPETGIGITFNKKIVAGSGTATLKIVNAGVAGTTVQSWGISSATISNVKDVTLGALVSDLTVGTTYQLDIPEGFVVDGNETSYAGTAYTFSTLEYDRKLFVWGRNQHGMLGQSAGSPAKTSSPTQIPGGDWSEFNQTPASSSGAYHTLITKTDGTMWAWGYNAQGQLGQGDKNSRSSPVQIPGTTWAQHVTGNNSSMAIKTDGTMWGMGENDYGQWTEAGSVSGNIDEVTQIPGTTWPKTGDKKITMSDEKCAAAIKTDGTLWTWGQNSFGALGDNSRVNKSSPVQVPGTTWNQVAFGDYIALASKTDGTLWSWGADVEGESGQNAQGIRRSSPVQIPGTTWTGNITVGSRMSSAIKTDGTLWIWGQNNKGQLGQNSTTKYSSPVQIPGTTWSTFEASKHFIAAIKTDGSLWSWGYNDNGQLGLNDRTDYSSPVQVGTDAKWTGVEAMSQALRAVINDTTP